MFVIMEQSAFEKELQAIRFLSEPAYNYLTSIPTKHWSRHSFTTTARSNMLTNNMCETFNAVIKEARDKPILTCLEWIRRYTMSRMTDKWDGAQKYTGKYMPYVDKVLGWVKQGAKDSMPIHSRMDHWEVDTVTDRFVVSLSDKQCSCNHWMLTGIPCSHAWSCIVSKGARPEDYLDECYSRDKYLLSYEHPIKPMPGSDHWDKTNYPNPLPPTIRVMPGRPSEKKRKLEPGEMEEGKQVKKYTCSNCGLPGHRKNKCPKGLAAKEPQTQGGRPTSTDPWIVANKKKKELRAQKVNISQTNINISFFVVCHVKF